MSERIPKALCWWLGVACFAALFVTLCAVAVLCVTPAVHVREWSARVGETLKPLPLAAQNVQDATQAAKDTVGLAREKVYAVDVRPVNQALGNVRDITASVKGYSDAASENQALIEEAGVLLWQHVDNTVGHVDKATLDAQGQQANITRETNAVLSKTGDTLDALQPTVQHLNTFTDQASQAMAHVNNSAAVADHVITAPGRLWRSIFHHHKQ
jgi:uncharacterized protein YoxC